MTKDLPHRRQNLLTGEWVLVSPQRMKRPWQGEVKHAAAQERPSHDASCYLCPGNERSGGSTNPEYDGTFVFPNDFPALLDRSEEVEDGSLFVERPATGEARVVCYSPDHSQTLARMDHASRLEVVETWCELSQELGSRWSHVELFENKGAMMGASSPHPHGQVWAGDFVPTLVQREDERQREYNSTHGRPLLADVATSEMAVGHRMVVQNDHWLVVVPHWAAWPFETLVLPIQPVARLEDLNRAARRSLAQILGMMLRAYDALFQTDFPYSMGWHGAPHGSGEDTAHWLLHAHFYPPLLRSAEIRKHMVGFELLAEAQRDLTPEAAAQRLRELIE